MCRHDSPDGGIADDFMNNCLRTGMVATAATTLAAAACGHVETGSPMTPINSVSHIIWEDEASKQNDASLRYTGTGLLLNTAAVTSWAAVYEALFGRARNKREMNPIGAMLGGVCVSGLAFFTDYYLVPKRFTPGFEKCLSNSSLFAIYTALAVGLGARDALNFKAQSTKENATHRR
jgi:hypothetical protein